jgi:hypothetical protein
VCMAVSSLRQKSSSSFGGGRRPLKVVFMRDVIARPVVHGHIEIERKLNTFRREYILTTPPPLEDHTHWSLRLCKARTRDEGHVSDERRILCK